MSDDNGSGRPDEVRRRRHLVKRVPSGQVTYRMDGQHSAALLAELPGKVWLCEVCGEEFDRQVWTCLACDHHWLMTESSCRNCHRSRDARLGQVAKLA